MRTIFLMLVVLPLAFFGCKPKKEITSAEQHKRIEAYRNSRQEQLATAGRWQEYQRTISEKNMAPRALEFTDTLKVLFNEDDITKFYDQDGRMTQGKFERKDGTFLIGNGLVYDAMTVHFDEMALTKGHTVSYLKKVDRFEIGRSVLVAPKDEIGKIETLNEAFLKGKWSVYKKDVPKKGGAILYIFEVGDPAGTESFELSILYDIQAKLTRYHGLLSIKGNHLLFDTNQGQEDYTVLEASGTEMILQQNEAIYYLKNLSN